MPAVLLQRHRIVATAVVFVLFAVAITAAVMRSSTLREEQEVARQHAAVEQAAALKADFERNKAAIAAAIRSALAEGRLDDADALLSKYRPVANGSLDGLVEERRKLR